MKFIYCLLFGSLISSSVYSQNCNKVLDNQTFFKSIQFGKPFPVGLFKCLKEKKIQYSNHTDYFLEYDSLNPYCKKKYSDLFTFQSTPFDFLKVTTNRKGQILHMELYSSFDDRREDSTDYAPPANFTKAYNDIVSLFGNPTRTELATGFDSLFFRETGMPRLVEWECSHILLQLRVRYGGNTKGLNGLGIQITDRNFDYIENIREAE